MVKYIMPKVWLAAAFKWVFTFKIQHYTFSMQIDYIHQIQYRLIAVYYLLLVISPTCFGLT